MILFTKDLNPKRRQKIENVDTYISVCGVFELGQPKVLIRTKIEGPSDKLYKAPSFDDFQLD